MYRRISQKEHQILVQDIDPCALKILHRLNEAGYEAYLVGGCVRDLLLGLHPKDFDVATNADPDEIRALFKNSRLIGRRFRLAHVYFGRHIIEVATFRAPHEGDSPHQVTAGHGLILRDNMFGSMEEDAWRRDFTINALYYDIRDEAVIDYMGGMEDLQSRSLKMIGDAALRYREDPVRMLRALRFLAKLQLTMQAETAHWMQALSTSLLHVSKARLFDEIVKLFHTGHALASFRALRDYHLLEILFPRLAKTLQDPSYQKFLELAFAETDHRLALGKHVSSGFLYGFLLWPMVEEAWLAGEPSIERLLEVADQVVADQMATVLISKRFIAYMREMWILQYRFTKRQKAKAYNLVAHPQFRAAYDLLLLRASIHPELKDSLAWWTKIRESSTLSDSQNSEID